MKIRKGKFNVIAESEHIFPLSDLDTLRSGSCMVCTDLTAEKADLSFGGIGSKEGYTTVLARTGLGLELFHDAEDRGISKLSLLKDRVLKGFCIRLNPRKCRCI